MCMKDERKEQVDVGENVERWDEQDTGFQMSYYVLFFKVIYL